MTFFAINEGTSKPFAPWSAGQDSFNAPLRVPKAKEIADHLLGGGMAGGIIFEYRCSKVAEHLTCIIRPPRSPYDKFSEILCPECLKNGDPVDAYLVFAAPEPDPKAKRNGV